MRDYGVDGQIGLEPTLEEYHARMLEVTAECMRVLKPTGVMFWNHGDSYGGSASQGYGGKGGVYGDMLAHGRSRPKMTEKCLVMQNERLIIKMIDQQGWILRNRIIWNKPNGMPSSVADRFSNKYEPVYMLTKQKSYWFDLDAVRVPVKYPEVWSRKGAGKDTPYAQNNPRARYGLTKHEIATQRTSGSYSDPLHNNPIHPSGMKNPGDVWFLEDYHFNRIYEINERYFETILTEEQAYWLGFLWGDGSISDGRRVRLSLQDGDKEHVVRFKNSINSEHPINPMGNGIGIEFSCVKMVNDLKNLQLKKKFPQIPEFLWRHFIRGFFDADGSISEGRPGEYEVSIVNGNKEILGIMGNIISDVINSDLRNITKDHSVWRIRWGGTDQCRGIRDYLYSGSTIFLARKFKKFPDGEIKLSKNTDLWTIPTQPTPFAHFATFPTTLIEPMIKAACPAEICQVCGMAMERIVDKEVLENKSTPYKAGTEFIHHGEGKATLRTDIIRTTAGWTSCNCNAGWIAGTVLDPFAGSGTVGEVCRKLNRNAILLELNPEYGKLIAERTMANTPPLTAYFGDD